MVDKPDAWEESEISKAFNTLMDDIDNGTVDRVRRPRECRCDSPGQDDGNQTCWLHHDCRDGSCTHTDGDE